MKRQEKNLDTQATKNRKGTDTKFLNYAMIRLNSQLKKRGLELQNEGVESLRSSFSSFLEEVLFPGVNTMVKGTSDDLKGGCPGLIRIALTSDVFKTFQEKMKSKNSSIENDTNYKFLVKINDYLYKDLDHLSLPILEKNTKELVIKAARNSIISMGKNYANELQESIKKAQKQEESELMELMRGSSGSAGYIYRDEQEFYLEP